MLNRSVASLAEYKFNIRSFHPEKTFGWSGMMFEGDNRGFSLQSSGTGAVTSRIWHIFQLNTHNSSYTQTTRSDPSKAPWSDKTEDYQGELAPRHELREFSGTTQSQYVKHFSATGHYWGVNHAMPLSKELQKSIGTSYVPRLDVKYQIKMDIDRLNRHIDLVVYITGDGFPNCEAFITDPSGRKIFIGVHVRKGAAPVTLALNLDYPMIVCALRIPIDVHGNFMETVGDELARRASRSQTLRYQNINSWNHKFLAMNPNDRRCMVVENFSLDGCFNR